MFIEIPEIPKGLKSVDKRLINTVLTEKEDRSKTEQYIGYTETTHEELHCGCCGLSRVTKLVNCERIASRL